MAGKRKSQPPLIIEAHPKEYDGYPFITLIQFKQDHILSIVDNADENFIKAYVLDLCGAVNLSEEYIILIAAEWYMKNSKKYPLSVEFSKRGLSGQLKDIYKTFNVDYVTRVIGPLPSYPMLKVLKVRRRRKKQVPKQVVVKIY